MEWRSTEPTVSWPASCQPASQPSASQPSARYSKGGCCGECELASLTVVTAALVLRYSPASVCGDSMTVASCCRAACRLPDRPVPQGWYQRPQRRVSPSLGRRGSGHTLDGDWASLRPYSRQLLCSAVPCCAMSQHWTQLPANPFNSF